MEKTTIMVSNMANSLRKLRYEQSPVDISFQKHIVNCRLTQFELSHPRHELNFRDLEALALSLYKKMNTAFAAYIPLRQRIEVDVVDLIKRKLER